jgi:hypothetical protein
MRPGGESEFEDTNWAVLKVPAPAGGHGTLNRLRHVSFSEPLAARAWGRLPRSLHRVVPQQHHQGSLLPHLLLLSHIIHTHLHWKRILFVFCTPHAMHHFTGTLPSQV